MIRLTTIFSTGDRGAALGALKAATELGLSVAGWYPQGSHGGPPSEATITWAKETLSPRMAARLNVQDSDGTLIVSFSTSLAAGSPAAYADEAAEHQRKASLHIVLPDGGRSAIPEDVRKGVLAWIAEEKIATLHVTGPREADEPGIQQAVHDALVWIFEDEVQPRPTFAGVDRTAAPESLAGAAIDRVCRETGVTFRNNERDLEDAPERLTPARPPSLRDALEEEHAAFERASEQHESFRSSVVDTIARIAAELPNRPLRPPMTTEDALRQIAATGDDDARLQALEELAHRHGDRPTHIAINPANVDAAIAAGLDVQIVPMDRPTDPRYSRQHSDAEALEWVAPPDAPFTVDAVHAPPTVRPFATEPITAELLVAQDIAWSPPPVPAEVLAARERQLAAHGPASHGASQELLAHEAPPGAVLLQPVGTLSKSGKWLWSPPLPPGPDETRSYEMSPPGGWHVHGPVSAPVPDRVVTEHPGYNGIAQIGCAVVGEAGVIEPAEASALFRADTDED